MRKYFGQRRVKAREKQFYTRNGLPLSGSQYLPRLINHMTFKIIPYKLFSIVSEMLHYSVNRLEFTTYVKRNTVCYMQLLNRAPNFSQLNDIVVGP